MKKKLLSIALVLSLLSLMTMTALAVEDGHVHERNDPASDCIVCQVAGMINALPAEGKLPLKMLQT